MIHVGNTNVCWRGCGSGGRTCQSVGYKYHVKLACYHTSFTKDRGDQSAWFYVKIGKTNEPIRVNSADDKLMIFFFFFFVQNRI